MVDSLVTKRLARAFPKSFINSALEFIAHKEANSWFRLEDCETEFDVRCKVLEWLSRDAYKTCPFYTNLKNERFHNFILNGINDFLGTDFTESDIETIYTYLGNRCNHEKTVRFIESGYDMSVLKDGRMVMHASCTAKKTEQELREMIVLYEDICRYPPNINDEEESDEV